MPGTTCTSSQPSWPKLSRICLVACTSTGAVMYSHLRHAATLRAADGVATRGPVQPDDVMTRPSDLPTRWSATPTTRTAWSTCTCRRSRARRGRWWSTCTAASGARRTTARTPGRWRTRWRGGVRRRASPEYRRVGGSGGWPATADDVDARRRGAARAARRASASRPRRPRSSGTRPAVTWCCGWRTSPHPVDRVVALAPVGDLRKAASSSGWAPGRPSTCSAARPSRCRRRTTPRTRRTRMRTRPPCEVVVVHGDRDDAVPVREQPRAGRTASRGSTTASSPASTTRR